MMLPSCGFTKHFTCRRQCWSADRFTFSALVFRDGRFIYCLGRYARLKYAERWKPMKRDMNLIRELLLFYESDCTLPYPTADESAITQHMIWLIEADLIAGRLANSSPSGNPQAFIPIDGRIMEKNGGQCMHFPLHIGQLFLDRSQVTDAGIRNVCSLKKRTGLDVTDTRISRVGLLLLSKLDSLDTLVLDDCKGIDDDCIETLVAFQSMTRLSIQNTSLTGAGVARLREKLSDCKIAVSDEERWVDPFTGTVFDLH